MDFKVIYAYFNSNVEYQQVYRNNSEIVNRSYSAFGFGVSYGWKWQLAGKVFIRYSMGLQAIAMNVPYTIKIDNEEYRIGENGGFLFSIPFSWFFGGPGSIIDFKLAVGI